tara:strand:+ start:1182 stop:1367 length:186 start_codon:yes stop_codon:yes gene_type:complete
MDFPSLGVKYTPLELRNSNDLTSQSIFGGPPMASGPGAFAQQTQQNKFQPVYGSASSVPFD